MEIVQSFCIEPSPGEIIIAGSFFMTPDIPKASSDISSSVLNARKNYFKAKESSSLLNHAALQTNEIRDRFNREEKRNEEKLQDQVSYTLTEDNLNIILVD